MAEKYVRCNSHCKYPAYDKEEVDALLINKANSSDVYMKTEADTQYNSLNNAIGALQTYVDAEADILSGTSDPSSSLGKDGDIYLKY